jgi:hypothetical protein
VVVALALGLSEWDEVRIGDRPLVTRSPPRPRRWPLVSGIQPLLNLFWIEPQPRARTAAEAHGAEPVGVLVDPRSRDTEAPGDLSRRHQPFMRRRNGVVSKQLGHASRDRLDGVIVEKRLALRWDVRRIHYPLTRRDALAGNRISRGQCVACLTGRQKAVAPDSPRFRRDLHLPESPL